MSEIFINYRYGHLIANGDDLPMLLCSGLKEIADGGRGDVVIICLYLCQCIAKGGQASGKEIIFTLEGIQWE